MHKIIAVVGMCGSGKSVATSYLEGKGWKKIYFGGVTYKMMADEGIERTPVSEKEFRENLRKKYGPACYAMMLLPEIKETLKHKDVVLDGLYSWYEYTYLKDNLDYDLKLICIVVDKNIRYQRIESRIDRSFMRDDAIERDISEIENLAKGGPIAYADYYLFNNGTLTDYYDRLNEILKEI